jgi:uncharacterized RDD family membrane protein YckC
MNSTECPSCLADTLFAFGFFILVLLVTPFAIAYRRGRRAPSDRSVTGSAGPVAVLALEPPPGFEFGGFWRRAVAGLLDAIILYGVLLAAAVAQTALPPPVLVVSNLVWLGVSVAYLPVQWAIAGRTLGMRILGLSIVLQRDGGPIGWGTSLLRFWGWIISVLAIGLGFLWIAFDARKRGWHDLIAETIVIHPVRAAMRATTPPGSG